MYFNSILPTFSYCNLGINIAGFLLMQFIAGFFSCQLCFCVPILLIKQNFPLPNNKGIVEKNWYVHQLETTANFSNTKSFFLVY